MIHSRKVHITALSLILSISIPFLVVLCGSIAFISRDSRSLLTSFSNGCHDHESDVNSQRNTEEEWSKNDTETEPAIENDVDNEDEDEEDVLYVPGSSHQISVEILHAEPSLVLSEERLIAAMLNVVDESSISMLSYHCYQEQNKPHHLNCFGILSDKSHLAMSTWVGDAAANTNGIEVELLSSGPNQVAIVEEFLPRICHEFAAGADWRRPFREDSSSLPIIRWKLELRSFPVNSREIRNPYWDDLGETLGEFNVKIPIGSITTPYQQIDVYDFFDPKHNSIESYFRSQSSNGSYESRHPEYFELERVVFLDGTMQSTSRGVEAYHEALVQPAMFAHSHPHRVAIVGGGEGSTLREVLKHESVERVLMIDIDEIMCKESARLLYPAWNGCDDFVSSTPSCFDDVKADVRYEDAFAWFVNRFYDGETKFNTNLDDDDEDELDSSDDDEDELDSSDGGNDVNAFESNEDPFDIIIMDALDPEDMIEFSAALYQNEIFWQSLYNALSEDGILVTQLGMGADNLDPPDELGSYKNCAQVRKTLEKIGFRTAQIYEEPHCGFEYPWTFLIACKSFHCLSNWYRNPAQVEHAIHRRIQKSKSGLPLLQNFDGPTMALYQLPHKAVQTTFCRSIPTPPECILSAHKAFKASQQLGETGCKLPFSSHLTALAILAVKNNLGGLLILDNFLKMDNDFTSIPENNGLNLSSNDCLEIDSLIIKEKNSAFSPVLDRLLPQFRYLLSLCNSFNYLLS